MSQAFPEWGAATNAPTMPAYAPPAAPGGLAQSPFGSNWDNPYVMMEGGEANVLQANNYNLWSYRTIFNHNGAELIKQYQKDHLDEKEGNSQDKEPDINIYYEQDDKYNSFGTVCFVKIDRALTRYISAGRSKASPEWLAKLILSDYKKYSDKLPGYPPIDRDTLKDAIAFELDKKSNDPNTVSNRILALCAEGLHKLADGIRSLKYGEADWNPANRQYKAASIVALVAGLKQRARDIDGMVEKMDSYKTYLPDALANIVSRLTEGIRTLCGFIDWVLELLQRIGKAIGVLYAFYCGFVNGLLDFIAGLVDTGALVLELLFDKVESRMLREGLENALQELREQPGKVKQQIKASVIDFFEHYNGDTNSAFEKAYHAGEDVITVISIVAIIRDALLALGKLASKFGKLEAWVKATAKAIKKDVQDILSKVATEESKTDELFRALKKATNTAGEEVLSVKAIKTLRLELQQKFGIELTVINKDYRFKARLSKWNERGVFASFSEKERTIFIRAEVSSYTIEHELHHMKLWYKMTQEFPEMAGTYDKLNKLQHEEYVLAEFMKAPEQWPIAELEIDLGKINDIRAYEYGLDRVNLEYFKKWQFPTKK